MIDIKADFDAADRMLSDIGRKHLPYAMAMAINDAASDALKVAQDEMRTAFDRPTRWTMNAFYVRRAWKSHLVATIVRKDAQRGRHYLEVQAKGGVRPQTALEKLVSSRVKYSGIIQTITPAKGARLNSNGNWSPGQRNQVLSAIKSQRDSAANTTKESRQRNKRRAGYFVPRDGSRLSPGVYQRMARGKVKKIVHFSPNAARYTAAFRFSAAVEAEGRRVIEKHFARRLKEAIATGR